MPKFKKQFKDNGSFTFSKEVIEDKNLKPNDFWLLIQILNLPDKFNYSAIELAQYLHKSKNTINDSLKVLENEGYLIRQRKFENNRIVDWEYIFADYKLTESEKQCNETQSDNSNYQYLQNQDIQNWDVVENKGFSNANDTLDSSFNNQNNGEEDREKNLDSSTISFKKYIDYEDMSMSENDYYELEKVLKASLNGSIDASKTNVIKYVKSLYDSETKSFKTKYGEPVRSLYGFVVKSFKHKTEQDKLKQQEEENKQFFSNDDLNNKNSNNPYSIYNY